MEHKRKREEDGEEFISVPFDSETHIIVSSIQTKGGHRFSVVYDPTIQQIQDLQICDPNLLQATLLLLCGIPPGSSQYVTLDEIVSAFSVMRTRYTIEGLQLQESIIREMLYDFLRAGIVQCNIKNLVNPNGLPRPIFSDAPIGGKRKLLFCLSTDAQREIFAPLQFQTSIKSIITNALELAVRNGENPTDVVGQSLIIHLELLRMFDLAVETEEIEEQIEEKEEQIEEEEFPEAASTPPMRFLHEGEETTFPHQDEGEEKFSV